MEKYLFPHKERRRDFTASYFSLDRFWSWRNRLGLKPEMCLAIAGKIPTFPASKKKQNSWFERIFTMSIILVSSMQKSYMPNRHSYLKFNQKCWSKTVGRTDGSILRSLFSYSFKFRFRFVQYFIDSYMIFNADLNYSDSCSYSRVSLLLKQQF